MLQFRANFLVRNFFLYPNTPSRSTKNKRTCWCIVIAYLFTKLPPRGDSKGTFISPIRLLPAHLCTAHGGGFPLPYNFGRFWFNPTGNLTGVYRFSSKRSIHSITNRVPSACLQRDSNVIETSSNVLEQQNNLNFKSGEPFLMIFCLGFERMSLSVC